MGGGGEAELPQAVGLAREHGGFQNVLEGGSEIEHRRMDAGDFDGSISITWYSGSLLRRVLLWRLPDPAAALLPSPAIL